LSYSRPFKNLYMKKIYSLLICFVFLSLHSQYLIVGKDSISAEKFISNNRYGLENSGVEKTIKNYIDFRLLQQFALEKKADTLSYFNKRMYDKEEQLRDQFFYPREIMTASLNQYMLANQTERKIQVFYLEKKDKAPQDYVKIYNEVKSGKMTMEDAIKKFTTQKPEPFFVKAGTIAPDLDREIQNLPLGGYTQLVNSSTVVAFAKLLDKRPSLGYMVFGTISYPNNADAENIKKQIFEALQSGKKFEEVAKQFGSTEQEKKNAGLVMGSPILPENVYEALKNKKQGEYSDPVLVGEKYYIFNVYSLIPYQLSETNYEMFKKELMNSQFADVLYAKLISSLIASENYKETPEFSLIKKSYQSYLTFKNKNAVLYQYLNKKFTFGELKKAIEENFKNPQELPKDQWAKFLDSKRDHDVFEMYSNGFNQRKDIREEMDAEKQNLLADFLFSYWIEEEYKKNPKILDDYYEAHKEKYQWEQRADARVAIMSDLSVKNDIAKNIIDPQKWESLNKKFYGKTNKNDDLMVHFEKGEMSENAEVFKVHGVPFKVGVHEVKINNRVLLIAVDKIIPPSPMSREEAGDLVKDDATEDFINKTIDQQRAKTKIVTEPRFMDVLFDNFKK